MAHNGAFLYIAFAGRTEHYHQFARGKRAQDMQHLLQTIRCVGIVDNHGELLPLVNTLHTSRDALNRAQSTHNVGWLNALTICSGDCGQAIAYVETSNQWRFNQKFAAGQVQLIPLSDNNAKTSAVSIKLQVYRANGGWLIYPIIKDGNPATGFQPLV